MLGTLAADMRPLFLLSLPRSGSTLLQRILGAHSAIGTAPEPWLLLPLLYATRETGAFAEYGQVPSSRAIREFAGRLPGGAEAYREELRSFVLELYGRAAAGDLAYFLDKTPRYHFIAQDLFELFPDARFVFLWRNPLSVVASIVETWSAGRWKLGRWHGDLFEGPGNLVAALEAHRDRAWTLRFEDLVRSPEGALRPLFDYLQLPFETSVLEGFAGVTWEARMGDRIGTARYARLSDEPLDKWRATIRGPVRTRWARAYLEGLGTARLEVMGYDLGALLSELEGVEGGGATSAIDAVDAASAWARRSAQRRAANLMWRGPSSPAS